MPLQDISVQEYRTRFKDGGEQHLLLDVRTVGEFVEARMPGAMNIPLNEVPYRVEEITEAAGEMPVVLVCRSGMRSMQAGMYLDRMGLPITLYNLDTGVAGWARERGSLERG
jgi:rhodanese-related sulfurtransferase